MDRADTIFALSSGQGRSAVAIVRLSGPQVRFALETLCGSVPSVQSARLRSIRDPKTGGVLDRGIVLFFSGPNSQTGEDVGELHCHGGPAVVAAMLRALGSLPGLRMAEPGEFARRAVFNGKMDLLDLEGLADLIDAETERQRVQAIEGGGSALRDVVEGWRCSLIEVMAAVAVEIDFSDEGDVAERLDSDMERAVDALIGELKRALATAAGGERIRGGVRVAIIGRPNAGKSSVLNALARRDVAIVSEVPGTTRDRIDIHLDLDGIPVIVSDTAGLRDSADKIEQEGNRRSRQAAREADLVLWLQPVDDVRELPVEFRGDVRVVASKADLGEAPFSAWCRVSTVAPGGCDELLGALKRAVEVLVGRTDVALVTRTRQRLRIEAALACLGRARQAGLGIEFVAEDLRQASVELDRLVGRIEVDDVLGAIYSRFCIGK
ncbi:MAG TPA: tRNA uridine-5-carboxymethylaminomethyl(34) synthesis GTPase MnmE [Beijerinckiaceae bacterium]|nr:tRNA uridine-5-carboxymethylaminomethyl(34) synthesis GTPase MnmE [Beijerinckiaceae bacterium]